MAVVLIGALIAVKLGSKARRGPAEESAEDFVTGAGAAGCTFTFPAGLWKPSSLTETNLVASYRRSSESAVVLLYAANVGGGSVDLDSLMVQLQGGLSPALKNLRFLHEPTPAPGAREGDSRYVKARYDFQGQAYEGRLAFFSCAARGQLYWMICSAPAPLADSLSSELHQVVSTVGIGGPCTKPEPRKPFVPPAR